MNTTENVIRLILVDDHTLVRAGIRALIERLPGVVVVGEASDGREAVSMVRAHEPNVVLMDISMPGLNGLESAARLSQEFPAVRVIILSMHDNEEYYWRAFKAGAAGYVLKQAATDELTAAFERVSRGGIYVSQQISTRLAHKFPMQGLSDRKSPLEQLTSRQREILQLIAEGHNTKDIADLLKISAKTVEYHRMKLMDCLSVHDVPGLVRLAVREGLVSQDA